MSAPRTPKHPRWWTEPELQILRDHYPHQPLARMVELLPSRAKTALVTKAKNMGLRKTPEARKLCDRANVRGKDWWDAEEIELLRRLWTTAPLAEVYPAFAPRRGQRAVQRKAEQLRLRRPRAEVRKERQKSSIKAAAITNSGKRARRRALLQTEVSSLQLQRLLLPACGYGSPNLTMVMAHPLEAAWRGVRS